MRNPPVGVGGFAVDEAGAASSPSIVNPAADYETDLAERERAADDMLRAARDQWRTHSGTCPTCGRPSFYLKSQDLYYHLDGTDHATCWDNLLRKPWDEPRDNIEYDHYDHAYIDATKLADLPRAEPLIDGVLDGRALFSITGRDGTYKSFLGLDWLLCLATGKPWQGHDARRARVLLVVGEGAYGLADRVAAWQAGWRTHLDPESFTIRHTPANLFRHGNDIDDLIIRVRVEGYEVVLFDTLSRNATGGNLNLPDDASTVIETLDAVRRATDGGSAGFVAHTNKGDLDTRGASNLEDDLDIVWHCRRDEDEQDVIAHLRKRKDGPSGMALRLRPSIVADTGSLVLQGTSSLETSPARPPKWAYPTMRLLAGSAVRDDGMSMSAVAAALGLEGKGSIADTFSWLHDAGFVRKSGTGRNTVWIMTGPGFVRLNEIGGDLQ
jgi:hypothetical protein